MKQDTYLNGILLGSVTCCFILILAPDVRASLELKLPKLEIEEKIGCGEGSPDLEAESSCIRYDEMEKTFGVNSWTKNEKKSCRRFFEAVHRVRNLVCSYQKELDKTLDGKSAEDGKKAAKSVHEKYLDLLSSRREYLGFSFQHYKNDLKSNLAMIPGKLRTEEANCKGGSSGINQTYLRVAAEIQLKDRYVNKIFPYIRKALNDSIRYAEEESGVEKKSKNLDHPKSLGSLPVEREGEPELGPKDQNGSHGDEHGEEMERDNLITHGAKEIAVDAIADTSMGAIALARYAGIAGAVACVSSHLLLEGHIDPRALMGEIIGIVSFPLGLTMIMLATAVENQEKREAYYRYWGIRKAKNSLMTMDTKSKDISKEFCEHLKNVKEEAENKQRDEMAERGQEMKRQHDRRTQMAEDVKVIRKARPEDRDRLIEEHRKKWSDETSP